MGTIHESPQRRTQGLAPPPASKGRMLPAGRAAADA